MTQHTGDGESRIAMLWTEGWWQFVGEIKVLAVFVHSIARVPVSTREDLGDALCYTRLFCDTEHPHRINGITVISRSAEGGEARRP